MKKLLSLLFVIIMVFSAVISSGAEILYEDTFDDFNEEFWVTEGTHFTAEDGVLSGWDDAVAHQSISDWNNPAPGAFKEFTAWIDVRITDEAVEGPYQAGIWYTNIYDYMTGILPEVERYQLMYRGDDSTVYLLITTDRKGKAIPADGVLASLKLENEPGMNANGDPVRLGIRVESGKITAYANGLVVGEHSYYGIGKYYSAIVLINKGCYVEFDNFAVGDLSENVAVRTRPYDYVPELHSVTVENGAATKDFAEAGELVTVTADVPIGKVFDEWEIVSGDGIDGNLLSAPEFTFEMPDGDVSLRAKLSDAPFVPGDANGDGKLNSRDVIIVMKAALAQSAGAEAPAGFVKEAGDMNGDEKINSRDVIAVMKAVLTAQMQ